MDLSVFNHEYDTNTFLQAEPAGKLFTMWTNEHCAPIYWLASFEEYSVRIVAYMANELACFVDIGAHHGYYSLLVGSESPNCKILAFEPVPENFQTVQKNLEVNHIVGAQTYAVAISNVEQTRDFLISTASDHCGFIAHPATPTKGVISVQARPLDAFRKEMREGPTLIKIDTAGHEIEILQGMQEVIKTVEDLRLIVEFNPKLLKLAGHAPEDLLSRLGALGFDLYLLSETDGLYFRLQPEYTWDEFLPADGARNILCLRRRRTPDLLFFSHSSGLSGAERSLLELVEYFRSQGGMCTVVLPRLGPLEERLKRIGAAVLISEFQWWCAAEPIPSSEQSRNLDMSFRNLLDIQPLLRKIDPEVILSQTTVQPWGALAAAWLGKPHIWSVTEFGELTNLSYYIPFANVLELIDESSNFILTNSQAVQKTLFDGLRRERIETVYRSIKIPAENSGEMVSDGFRREQAVHLLIVGSVIPLKGQIDAVRALRELVQSYKKDVELVILGGRQPDYHKQLVEIIDEENLQEYVHFVDFQEDVFPILRQADIVLMCSRMEAFGRSTLEAMLCAKPVIGTNQGGNPELIQDGITGFLYKPEDYHSLAEKIAYLCENPKKCKELGLNGLDYARRKFTPESTHERVLQIASGLRNEENPLSTSIAAFIFQLSSNSLETQRLAAKQNEQCTQSLLGQQEQRMQSLSEQHEQHVQSLSDQYELRIQSLSDQHELRIQSLSDQHELRVQSLSDEHEQLIRLLSEQHEQRLQSSLGQKEQVVQSLSTRLVERERELAEIYKSKAWRLVQFYRDLVRPIRNIFR